MDIIAFREDLVNMSLEDACIKHNISLNDAMQFLMRNSKTTVLKENVKKSADLSPTHHMFMKSNRWWIRKTIKKDTHIIGAFLTVEDAQIIRDALAECDWDFSRTDEFLEEYNIPLLNKWTILKPTAYLIETKVGNWTVRKHFFDEDRGSYHKSFGTYRTLEEAQKVRDELIKCNWDISQLDEIRALNNIKNISR